MNRGIADVQPAAYTPVMQAMHWGTQAVVLCTYVAAWMIDDAPGAVERAWLIALHRSLGITILLLTGLRLLRRWHSRIPALPNETPLVLRVAARFNTAGMYGLLIVQPMLGLMASMLHDGRVVLFGVALPPMVRGNAAVAHLLFRLHSGCALAFLASLGLHAVAALYYYYSRNDRTPARMRPGALLARVKGSVR
jgi:cytochrome b561